MNLLGLGLTDEQIVQCIQVLDKDGETRAVPRDTPLDGSGGAALAGGGALAVRLLATRRSRWQRGAGRAAPAGGGE